MNIEDAIADAVVAICASHRLSKLFILKGGGAMRLFDGMDARLSIDADFSIAGELDLQAESVFKEICRRLAGAFKEKGYELLDFKVNKRPRKIRAGFPPWWGGWACEFKLVDRKHHGKSLETRRRNALVPVGANSSKISIDLSEHEYCGIRRTKTVRGAIIHAYSREMLVLEKLRAICQQHPDYPYRQETKNRARDFYDIHALTQDIDAEFIHRCRRHIEAVFRAKDVPLWILRSLWNDESFVDTFRRGFDQVRDTLRGPANSFDVYLEHLRFLLKDIYPNIPDHPK